MKRSAWIVVVILIAFAAVAVFIVERRPSPGADGNSGAALRIVAAENFYGSIAEQVAGGKASVVSIISNPNVDPHEYDATVQDGAAVANADIVIENGLQYDGWMDKLISASPNTGRIVIAAGEVAPDILPENPHVWYGVDNVKAVALTIADALIEEDPADAAVFRTNLVAFDASLDPIITEISAIKARYAGAPVALTETIFLYMTGPMGLDVMTPVTFQRAIAEGNDPSAQDVAAANREIAERQVNVLIYNSQTITPITTNLENAAIAKGIPIVAVTETMPAGVTYQQWMMGELGALQAALAEGSGSH